MLDHRSWILQRSNIELLRECQRLIYEQFSEKLSLTQNDLIEKIFLFAINSSNPRFNDTVERLRHSLEQASIDTSDLPGCGPAAEQEPEPTVRVSRASEKVYRGRRVMVELPELPVNEPQADKSLDALQGEPLAEVRKKPRRVYRGRVIED